MKRKILVTGATGFIGSHLVETLLKDGVGLDDLRLLILPGQSLQNLPPKKFDIIWGDIRDKKVVKNAVLGVETIYHLAAKTVFEGKTYADFRDVNVEGTRNLLQSVKDQRIQKFVLFSSISVYGLPAYCGVRINCDESWPKIPAEAYGESKLEAERLLVMAHKIWKIPYVIIRPTTVYGPRDHQGIVELYKAIKGCYFFRIGNGNNKMDYVYVDDLVKGARQAQLSKYISDDFILGSNVPTTMKEVINYVSSSINKRVSDVYIPKNIAMILSYIVKSVSEVVGIKPPLFPERVKIMTTDCYFNSSKAKKLILYNPSTTFEKGSVLTGKWLLKNKRI